MAAAAAQSLPTLLRAAAADSSSVSASSITVPAELEDPASTAHAQLLSLTSQSLADLRAQPAALKTAASSLDGQLSTLCARHVTSFVQVHQATRVLPSALDQLDDKLHLLINDELPALSAAVQSFSGRIEAPLAAKERARNLIEQYNASLKDLLDIPRLVTTCVRANHPIEALLLGAHIARLARTSRDKGQNGNNRGEGPGGSTPQNRSAILDALKDECWVHLRRLREDLLRGLGSRGVRLPAARRYLSILRRFRDIDEAAGVKAGASDDATEPGEALALSPSTICLSFLSSRWETVNEIGTDISDYDDAATVLASQLSRWRDTVGDTCGIASALFADTSSGTGTSEDTQAFPNELSPLTLLSTFALRSLRKLEGLTQQMVSRINGSQHPSLEDAYEALSSLHMQYAYAASSLARHGLDLSFSPGIRTAFEDQARSLREQKGLQLAEQEADEIEADKEGKGDREGLQTERSQRPPEVAAHSPDTATDAAPRSSSKPQGEDSASTDALHKHEAAAASTQPTSAGTSPPSARTTTSSSGEVSVEPSG